MPLSPRMSGREFLLFEAFVRCAYDYVEFGTGGSTYVASNYVKGSIRSVDSSRDWLAKVHEECQGTEGARPELMFADIGPTGEWGMPIDPTTRDRWPHYHAAIWTAYEVREADTYFIDGRFRVASFLQAIIHCRPDAILMFHDFRSRPYYHAVLEVATEVAVAEDLSVFRPLGGAKPLARRLLQNFKYDPQ
jgi:hypothetical protein